MSLHITRGYVLHDLFKTGLWLFYSFINLFILVILKAMKSCTIQNMESV